MSNAIKEALLEGGRVVLLAVISYLLTAGVIARVVVSTVGVHLDANLQLIITGAITSALRGIDKLLHEHAKDTGREKSGILGAKGLTGF